MERDNTQNRKRTRDEENIQNESHKGKKQEIVTSIGDSSYTQEKGYDEFNENMGVFDFPWLKEGVIFRPEEFMEPEIFSELETFTPNLEYQSFVQNSPAVDQKFDRGDTLWPFDVDDLEPLDCIWRAVIDQPLDIGLNKA